MPRPKLHSDVEILQKAKVVLLREGPVDFTLSDVAKAVGMSRAALIQRMVIVFAIRAFSHASA